MSFSLRSHIATKGGRGEGKAKAKGETEIEADRGHYVYVSFVELFRIGKAPNRNCIN